MRLRSHPLALLLAMAGLGVASPARAVSNTARLVVTGANAENGCADAARLGAAVEARLGRPVFQADALVVVRVSYRAHGGGWVAQIVLADNQDRTIGERELVTSAERCEELDSSVALVAALLVDAPLPSSVTQGDQGKAAEASTPPSAPLFVEEEKPRQPPTEPWRFMVGADAVALYGRVPGFLPGARLGFDFKPPRVMWFRLEAAFYLPRTIEDESTAAAARVTHETVALAACPWVGARSPAPSLCLGQELSFTQASGMELDQTHSDSQFGLTIFARAGLGLHLGGPVWLRVGLTGGVPLVRDRYIFIGSDRQTHELFRTRPVLASGELGLAIALP